MKRSVVVLTVILSVSASAGAGEGRLTSQQAKGTIDHLSEPTGSWNGYTSETRVVTIADQDLQPELTQLEKNFWSQCTYAAIAPSSSVDYHQVVKYAEGGGISVFRDNGQDAKEKYLADFVSQEPRDKKARAALVQGLPAENAFGVGYTDELSDPYGDELFVFPFIDGNLSVGGNGKLDLLVVTIHHG